MSILFVAQRLDGSGCMLLSTKIGLSPGDIVLDGDPPPPWKGVQQPPLFGPRPLWPNGWADRDIYLKFVSSDSEWINKVWNTNSTSNRRKKSAYTAPMLSKHVQLKTSKMPRLTLFNVSLNPANELKSTMDGADCSRLGPHVARRSSCGNY